MLVTMKEIPDRAKKDNYGVTARMYKVRIPYVLLSKLLKSVILQ